jgi:exopolysaccharide biosynthesis polyprenyl glycosylphosphotransferase
LVLGFRSGKSNDDVIVPHWAIANHRTLRQVGAALFAIFIVITAFQLLAISRLFLFTFVPILYLTLLACNRYFPGMIARRLFRGSREERILLVGSVSGAAGLRRWLDNKLSIGLRTVGILSDDPLAGGDNQDYPFLGGTCNLERAIRDFRITQVLLADLPLQSKVLQNYVEICERAAVRILAASDIEERFRHSVLLFEDDGRRFIALRDEPLQDPLNRALKRLLDLAISLPVAVLLLPPVSLFVWALQRWQSPGPVFFTQQRAGSQNRSFKIIKFRTMHHTPAHESRQATRNDKRTYPAGRWLRTLSIDEIPQFLNVLAGEMSVVGPRPHLGEHNEIFARALNNFHVRAYVKPGITGLAQVRGYRGEIKEEREIVERVTADIYYLEHWSLALDSYIILQTVKQVLLPPERAY